MRGFLVLIFALGMFASLMGHMQPRSSHVREVSRADIGEEEMRIAEVKARNTPQFTTGDGAVELQRDSDGHFYADVQINGSNVHMLVDTGASSIALSREDAQAAGIATSIGMNDVVGQGADGPIHGEYAQLDRVELGPLSATGLHAVILNSGNQSLLGQSFLSKFNSVEIQGDTMVLRE